MKSDLKPVYEADFAKQALNMQEVSDAIWELLRNQAQAEVTKSLRLILTYFPHLPLAIDIIH